jgi:galactokinase
VLEVAGLLRAAAGPAAGPPAGAGDVFGEIGRLLTQSHRSLRDDFEISWPEADVAVDTALAAGALGARMIGGGFGGSVLALIPAQAAGAVRSAVTGAFGDRSWAAPEFLAADPSDGARRLGLQ